MVLGVGFIIAENSNTYTNATWAELAGIPLKELNVSVVFCYLGGALTAAHGVRIP